MRAAHGDPSSRTAPVSGRGRPVRFMGFPPLPSNKRPIYVIEQQNEAIYIQLDTAMVAAFLQRNGVLAQPPTLPRTIGGSLHPSYTNFQCFLTTLTQTNTK